MDNPDLSVEIPLYIDLLAVFVGAVSGALIAIRNRYDFTGVIVVALVSGLGGGLIRDVLIGRGAPAALRNEAYLYVALVAALAGLMFRAYVVKINTLIIIADAASLAMYTVVGIDKGLAANLPLVTAALLGVITATGGGLLRDILGREVPQLIRPGHFVITASIAGVVVFAALYALGVDNRFAGWTAIAVAFSLRVGSVYFNWMTPEASTITEGLGEVGAMITSRSRIIRYRGIDPDDLEARVEGDVEPSRTETG